MRALVTVGLLLLFSSFANAEVEFPAKARLFVGGTSAEPSNLNQEMTALGIKKFDTITKFGVEITYSVSKFLDAGFVYTKRYQNQLEVTPTLNQDYHALLNQDSFQGIVRVPFLRTNILRLDAFGAAGLTSTNLEIETATQNGELKKDLGGTNHGSLVTSFGASVAVGYKNFFLVFEGGMEQNKVKKFARTGNLNNNIQEIDLSGSYFQIGLMFDGVKATKR